MPAHIKASLLGPALTLPVRAGASPWGPGRASTCASTATTAGGAGPPHPLGRGGGPPLNDGLLRQAFWRGGGDENFHGRRPWDLFRGPPYGGS